LKPGAPRRRALPADERRRQIIEAVFHVVSEHGIPGATIGRVAESAGVGIGTIYRYFDSQKAMLQFAVEALSSEMTQPIYDGFSENALDHIRETAQRRHALVSSNGGALARLWMEFVTANANVGLHDTVVGTQWRAFQAIREVCERGKAQGTIRLDADADLVAYQLFEQAWGADMSVLMGLNDFLQRDCATSVLSQLLDSIAAHPAAEEPCGATDIPQVPA